MLNPHLPPARPDLEASHTRRHRAECGPRYHRACLELSQSLWQQEKPAQAILQLNKAAFVPDLPAPYPALVWYLAHRSPHLFIGNPVRHFQHLATRITGANAQLRSWRAWACFHLAHDLLPAADYPCDQKQIDEEALEIPGAAEVAKNLPDWDSSGLSDARALVTTFPSQRP